MTDLFTGSPGDAIPQRCVLCGRKYIVHRDPRKSKPHRCPAEAVFDEADRLAALMDDPDGPSLEELVPDMRKRRRFEFYGLFLEG